MIRLTHVGTLVGLSLWLGLSSAVADTLLEDEFEFFELGETWKEHGIAAPDILEVDGEGRLQMRTSGIEEGFFGIETITPITLSGLIELKVDTRLKPENAGVEGTVAAAEVALVGESGTIVRAFASNNAGPDPESINDWANHYEDSEGNMDTSGPWPHCTDKGGPACDAVRNLVLTVSATGTTLEAFDDFSEDDEPRWQTSFDDLQLADLGSSVTIALRQLTVEDGDDSIGFFDSIFVEGTQGQGVPGDFDGNGLLDTMDIDLLSAEVRDGNHSTAFDLNADSIVDQEDRRIWVDDLKSTWMGDSNLDGEFNTGDLVSIFQQGKFELDQDASWADGDWDGDNRFGTGDLVSAFQAGGFEQGPRAQVASVPEPASPYVILVAGALLFRCRSNRR